MKLAATLLVLISFIGLAVFSVAFMGAAQHHNSGFSACVGSLTQGVVCPPDNSIETASFHLGAFKFFSNSTVSSSSLTAAIYLSLAFVLILAFASIYLFSLAPAIVSLVSFGKSFKTSFQPFKKKLNSWRSLHENSPSCTVTGFRLPATG